MNQTQTLKAIKAVGRELTVKRTESGEYRISFAIEAIQMHNEGMSYTDAKARNEAIAYYTEDASDALATAESMHDWYVNRPNYLKAFNV